MTKLILVPAPQKEVQSGTFAILYNISNAKVTKARCKSRDEISNIGAIRRESDVEIIGCRAQLTFDGCEVMRW